MTRAVVNVATREFDQRGARRLRESLRKHAGIYTAEFWERLPAGWPSHRQVPFAFKAHALITAAKDYDLLLWCDSSILAVRDMRPIWDRIEQQGHWFSACGFDNYTWTADSAYVDLFPQWQHGDGPNAFAAARSQNRLIPHLVAGCFGVNAHHPQGKAFLSEFYRLSQTRAFCGPTWNSAYLGPVKDWRNREGAKPCGPPDVAGHRHDQTAASVIAYRLDIELTDPPLYFAYAEDLDKVDERTILVAKGIE